MECRIFVKQRAGRARRDTRAAIRTSCGLRKRRIQINNDLVFDTAISDVERVNAFDFVASPDASRTENAAIVIDAEKLTGEIHRKRRVEIWIPDRINAKLVALLLEIAITLVHRADRADVIAFTEK